MPREHTIYPGADLATDETARPFNIATDRWLTARGFQRIRDDGQLYGFYRLQKKSTHGLWTTIFAKAGENKSAVISRAISVSLGIQ